MNELDVVITGFMFVCTNLLVMGLSVQHAEPCS